MKELILLRHAKSSWKEEYLSDIDRPLNKRGYDAAHEMGFRLARRDFCPELVITSSANRAVYTAILACRAMHFDFSKLRVEPALYHASVQTTFNVIREVKSKYNRIMVVGHNPTTEAAGSMLVNSVSRTRPDSGHHRCANGHR